MKINSFFSRLTIGAGTVVLALILPKTAPSQSPSYPVGIRTNTSSLPDGLARSWVVDDAALAGAQLRQIQNDRQQAASQRALASLALAAGEMRRRQTDAADRDLQQATAWAPVRSIAAQQIALLHWEQQDWPGVLAVARRYATALHGSLQLHSVAHMAVQSAIQTKQWTAVLEFASGLSMGPERLSAEGQALQALGRESEALQRFEQLEDEFPASAEASARQNEWQQLLHRHPEGAPGWRQLTKRADAWRRAGNARKAAETLNQALRAIPAARQAAFRMQLARNWARAGEDDRARALLPGLMRGATRPEALLLKLELARSRDDLGTVEKNVNLLRKEKGASSWYRRALWEAGNEAILQNDLLLAQAHYSMVAARFPHSSDAATAAWRAAWIAYRLRQPDAGARMEALVRRYPTADQVPDALYWRGRWAEQHGAAATARQYYQIAAERFPGSYFGGEAVKRLAALRHTSAPEGLLQRLRQEVPDPATPQPGPLTASERMAMLRARQLASAWMLDPAAAILQSALRPSSRGALTVARQLAAIDQQRESWSGGIIALERAVPDSLGLDWEQLPRHDWNTLYPYPYRSAIQRAAAHWNVSPWLVLGLIRQESDFNPNSLSHAQARGLMQLLYGTAKYHLREIDLPRLTPDDLFRPEINIPIGVAEFKSLLDEFNGEPAYALAAYNAGGSRVRQWLQQGPYSDVDEFIESIPFHETRGYVQAVLRNAEHYRHLYQPNPS